MVPLHSVVAPKSELRYEAVVKRQNKSFYNMAPAQVLRVSNHEENS